MFSLRATTSLVATSVLLLSVNASVLAQDLVNNSPASINTAANSGDSVPAGAAGSQADTDLREVVISATRTVQPLELTGTSVSVISASDLATQQLLILSSALAEVPGVNLTRTGGPGQDTSLYIRGADPGETVVLIDGIRINDPSSTDGQAILADLFVNDFQRIEVLRGPQSTLYGSDAMGGVVNIITQRGGSASGTLEAGGGSYGTWRVGANLSGTAGLLEYGAGVNDYHTRGISAVAAGPAGVQPDGDRNLDANLNLRLHVADTISVDLRGIYLQSQVGMPGFPPPDFTLQVTPQFGRDNLTAGYAALNGSWLDGVFTSRLALTSSDSNRRYFGVYDPVTFAYAPAENFYAQGGSTRWEYQGVLQLNTANQITFGADTQLSTLLTDSLPDPFDSPTGGNDRLSGYYAQWQSTLWSSLTLTGGLRRERDQLFGGHTAVKLAAAWQLPDGATVVRADYGDGFKAPTLYELFSQYSNPLGTLQPETARGWEAGIDHTLLDNRLRASVTYFDRHEGNEIEFDDCFTADPGCVSRPFGFYYNVDRSRDSGVEAELAFQPSHSFSAWANYTHLNAIDELTGLELVRRPNLLINASMAWTPRAGASLGGSYGYQGSRFDDPANTVTLAAAENIDLFASWPLTGSIQLLGRVENLFDNQSEPAAGYRALGRAVYAGLRAKL